MGNNLYAGMKFFFSHILVFLFIPCWAQQTIVFTQNTFNKAGLNPAASGGEINRKIYYAFGANRQWFGFENSPKQNFVNISYTLRPPRSYSYWQNFGLYIDDDQSGLIVNQGVYLGYAIHFLVRKKMAASFGAYLGGRKYTRSISLGFDPQDKALAGNSGSLLLYPDFIPGFRIESKKFFSGISVRQITINKLRDFRGRKIGSPQKLLPTIFLDYGRYVPVTDRVLMMPSVTLNMPVFGPPIMDANLMFYFFNRFATGISLRNNSFLGAVMQVRFLKNITAGFAYNYPINATRFTNINSFEIMIGVTPMAMDLKVAGKHSIAKCPLLNY